MSLELEGKTAIVTGAARGIGKNIARTLVDAGASVVIADINAETGQETATELDQGNGVSFVRVDLDKSAESDRMIKETVEKFGRLDLLVNNARSMPEGRRDLMTEDDESWDVTMSVTLRGTFMAARAALRYWEANPTEDAAIVNIASISGLLSSQESPAYHAAKGGLVNLTRYLADVSGPMGVRVNAVAPGLIVQDEHRLRYNRHDNVEYRRIANMAIPVGRAGRSDEIAQAVLFLGSSRSSFISGQILTADGGSSVQEQWTLLHRSI